jgi:hypothetical protein
MNLVCPCPANAALTAITINACEFRVGQIQKLLFQRLYASAGVKNELTIASANPNVIATWTPLIAATGATKVVCSPILANPGHEVPDARVYGGGNATPGGIEKILGSSPSKFTAEIHNTRQDAITTMQALMCEKLIGVYMIDENGKVWGKVDSLASPTKFYPIPIHSVFVSDLQVGGYENPDMNKISFMFPTGWAALSYAVTPLDYDALYDLVPA